MSTKTMTLDEIQAFIDHLKTNGLEVVGFRWGITEVALRRGAGRPVETIEGSDTDSKLHRYRLPDGSEFWDLTVMGPDDRDGVAWFTHSLTAAAPAIIEQGRKIEAWLDQNPDAYDLFIPIKWSAAPDRAKTALEWLNHNEHRWKPSPLAPLLEDLKAELIAATGGAP